MNRITIDILKLSHVMEYYIEDLVKIILFIIKV
jgi:hypothetical protein